jgi:hypothetical protein
MKSTELVTSSKYANAMYFFSHLWFLNSFYGYSKGHYFNSLVPFTVGTFSLLYWRNPMYNWVRKADIFSTLFATFYVNYMLFYLNYFYIPLFFDTLGAANYILGWCQHNKGNLWCGTICHMLMHMSAHSCCFVLFNTPLQIKLEQSTSFELSTNS